MNSALDQREPLSLSRSLRTTVIACSITAIIWLLAARILGPSDAWDQTQPPTMAYTTDIIANGRWILPVERGEYPATKPPLYNWLAVPMVKLMGFSSDLAHKSPSVVSLLLCWLIVVRLGRRLDGDRFGALGWLAGLMVTANYTFFKLGYLARPDMLLTLWLTLGWVAATTLLLTPDRDLHGRRGLLLRIAFWGSVLLAALTKGPPAIILPLYAFVAARPLRGSVKEARIFGWWWGLPLAVGVFGLWVWGVYRIDPEHLIHKLWFDEVAGRVTGLGAEGNEFGPIEFVRRLVHMPTYYLLRFAPWSVLSILGMIAIWSRTGNASAKGSRPRHWTTLGQTGAWLNGAAVFVVIIIVLFTLSTGKRADYVAAAFVPGALLSGWWVRQLPERFNSAGTLTAQFAAVVVLATMTGVNQFQHRTDQAPPEFGDAINDFIHEVEQYLQAEPRPVVFWAAGETHLQGHLGYSEKDGTAALRARLEAGEPFWLIAGRRSQSLLTVGDWLLERRYQVVLSPTCRSDELPRYSGWPGVVGLYRVEPLTR
ncbi:MAG: hypothetical protein V3T84_08715 [Phycisphaerales bacterium]